VLREWNKRQVSLQFAALPLDGPAGHRARQQDLKSSVLRDFLSPKMLGGGHQFRSRALADQKASAGQMETPLLL
jgi:hypothetical protein